MMYIQSHYPTMRSIPIIMPNAFQRKKNRYRYRFSPVDLLQSKDKIKADKNGVESPIIHFFTFKKHALKNAMQPCRHEVTARRMY